MRKLLNAIIHGDCLVKMENISDNSVYLIFVDPPYYLQLPKGKRLKLSNGTEIIPVDNEWNSFESYDHYDNFTQSWISVCQRILKPTGTFWVIGMYHNIFRVGTIMQNLGMWFLNDVIWVKTDALTSLNGRRFTNNHETLIWSVKNKDCKRYTFNYELMKKLNSGKQMKDRGWIFGLCKGNERLKDENRMKAHSTQKPLKLIQQIVLAASNKGDIVFDPFIGSGTTAVVADALGRKWLGVEKDEKYVQLARDIVKEFTKSKK